MNVKQTLTLCNLLLLTMLSTSASAHTGAGGLHGFAGGFIHPWLGVDHLLAMLAIGLWAAKAGGRSLWLLPSSFMMAMAAGALLNFAGLSFIGAEIWVALSVLALGLILTLKRTIAMPAAMVLVVAFALGHGYVHAAEMGPDADAWTYALGFLTATACLHGLGLLAGLSGTTVIKMLRGVFAWLCMLAGAALIVGI